MVRLWYDHGTTEVPQNFGFESLFFREKLRFFNGFFNSFFVIGVPYFCLNYDFLMIIMIIMNL